MRYRPYKLVGEKKGMFKSDQEERADEATSPCSSCAALSEKKLKKILLRQNQHTTAKIGKVEEFNGVKPAILLPGHHRNIFDTGRNGGQEVSLSCLRLFRRV